MSSQENHSEKPAQPRSLISGTPVAPINRAAQETKAQKARWTDLEELYDVYREGIAMFINQVNEVLQLSVQSKITLAGRDINATFKVISDDITRFSQEANSLRAVHINKTGYVKTTEDHVLYLTTYDNYRSALALFQGCTQQHAISLTEISLAIHEMVSRELNANKAAENQQGAQ